MILGIDPGAHGAIAVLSPTGELLGVHDMPTVEVAVGKGKRTRLAEAALAGLIKEAGATHAFVERVSAMPGQGVSSMFAFGEALGIAKGILAALAVPTTHITPQQWKRAMRVTDDKGGCRLRAMQLFPASAAQFSRAKDDGRAEAALIALHGIQTLKLQQLIAGGR
jgi:crossover junction endodeoxyribonuclease RuvC